ncbi:heme transporter HRG1 [Platysternon megacephalum]|uniref:Heme transporter HRG1 n=1 Tax=Platysternon megacephalum TaxID=55544 RepID=A0A4D9DYJ3_9SAUR|nr:heme transporter HRG1 [Platysternon megacephalum]
MRELLNPRHSAEQIARGSWQITDHPPTRKWGKLILIWGGGGVTSGPEFVHAPGHQTSLSCSHGYASAKRHDVRLTFALPAVSAHRAQPRGRDMSEFQPVC